MNPDSSEVNSSCAGAWITCTNESGAYNLHNYIYVDMFMLNIYINKHKVCL